MGAIVVPAIEGLEVLVLRALAALGVGLAIEEGAKTGSKEKTSDCAESAGQSQCNQCRLRDGFVGQAVEPRYVTGKTRINYDYQLYIANLFAGPERFFYVKFGDTANTRIDLGAETTKDMFGNGGIYTTTEWSYGGLWFDGFWRSRCTVVEAKANYEHMWGDGGDDKPWAEGVVRGWVGKVLPAQIAVVQTASPQGKLEWHFMQLIPYRKAIDYGIPTTIARLTPMPTARVY
ncbi:Tox-REase-5 domain-containing protein [Paraburkholderia domus]|jgi:hypothetical protein|uniref:Tox-REase-5 domain-containing protein n=1 Tax=Paraburkholderia domus TaxID=2793075 RepID=A0A9N8NHA8_9BURK|nr:Tox-REase-5 domain-containing protein [Paraburkholderia domus]MBK5054656.1 hypothetical protein [Burkholderia sp. R-70006]MBK5066460.1 hypothetical protein [Burkholderia sp. R-70199]MBK5125883.1 hypothetical protein [Burkholderia sp. R-69980]MBK5170109.1 hypothetical protein [Burkholderia sp. R-70211]CAE6864344.1 hypothetical protein R70006_08256 [Paraburkholderia domus]